MVKGYDYKILTCEECVEEFVLTVDAQEYMAGRGKVADPRWCRTCYVQRKKAERKLQKVDDTSSLHN